MCLKLRRAIQARDLELTVIRKLIVIKAKRIIKLPGINLEREMA